MNCTNNYNHPKFYHTGFLPITTEIRAKQGLDTQEIATACYSKNRVSCGDMYPIKLHHPADFRKLFRCTCSKK